MAYEWSVENFEGRKLYTATPEMGGENACKLYIKNRIYSKYLVIRNYETRLISETVIVDRRLQ